MTTQSISYQVFLKNEMDRRKQRNPAYSLRAFARDLGISVSKLSLVLRGLKGLSAQSGKKIASRLGLTAEEADYFVSLIEAKHSRSRADREKATQKVNQMRFSPLALDLLRVMSDWHYFAILELTNTVGFKSNPKWIAKRLGIPESQVKDAIQKLFDLQFLKSDDSGKWTEGKPDLATPTDIPSRELRHHHHQILNKAKEVLEEVPVDERDFTSMTFSFSSSQMGLAKKMIKDFRRQMANELSILPQEKDRVYSLAIQLIPLDKTESKANSIPDKSEVPKSSDI